MLEIFKQDVSLLPEEQDVDVPRELNLIQILLVLFQGHVPICEETIMYILEIVLFHSIPKNKGNLM